MGFHVCFIRYKDMICIGDIRARWIYGLKTFKVGCLFYILIVSQRNMYLIMRWLYNTWWKSFAHHHCKSNTNQILQQCFTANSWFFGATISIDPEIDFNDHAIDPFPTGDTEVWRWSLTCIGIQIWVNSVAITLVCMCHHVKAARWWRRCSACVASS